MNKTYNSSGELSKNLKEATKLRATAMPNIHSHSKYRSVSPITARPVSQVDELKDNLLKVKDNFNKKTKEIRDLKLVFNRLNQDQKVNVKLIENILKSANRAQEKPVNDLREQIIQGDFTQQNISKLKETHHTLILKRQNQEIKAQIEESVKKLEDLKNKTKIVRLNELENNLKAKNDKIEMLTRENEMLQEQVEVLEKKVEEANKSVEGTKNSTTELKTQHQELLGKLQKETEKNEALKKTKMVYEERTSNQRFCIANLKQQLKQNDEVLKQHEKTKDIAEKFVKEKASLEKAEEEKSQKLKELTNELQALNEKAKQLEADNSILNDKIDVYEKERARCLPYLKEQSSAYKEKDRKIKQLEEQIKKETQDKACLEKEMKDKLKQFDDEEERLVYQIDVLNQKVTELNQLNATVEGEIKEVEAKIKEYEKKAEKDKKDIDELNVKLAELNKANEDKELLERKEETQEDIDAKKEIEELDVKIKAAEAFFAQELTKKKETEEVIKKLTEESESKKEIDSLSNEIEAMKKEIKELKRKSQEK